MSFFKGWASGNEERVVKALERIAVLLESQMRSQGIQVNLNIPPDSSAVFYGSEGVAPEIEAAHDFYDGRDMLELQGAVDKSGKPWGKAEEVVIEG